MHEESIYQALGKKALGKGPYLFQDPYLDGKRDIEYVMLKDGGFNRLNELMACDLINQIEDCFKEDCLTENFSVFLEANPIYLYLTALNRRLKLCLSEGLIDARSTYQFGISLAAQSKKVEEVKLGMLLLGFFENDFSKQILKTLGLHSEFTLYALEAAKNFKKSNKFIFDLVQNTLGYGKLIALYLFEPIFPIQKEWLFEHGALNEVACNMSAIMCLEKVDMADYYEKLIITKTNFSKLAYLLAYAFENSNPRDFYKGEEFITKFLEAANHYASSFIDLVAVVVIEKSLNSFPKECKEVENLYGPSETVCLLNLCAMIITWPKWKHIVLEELQEPKVATSLIVAVLQRLKLRPSFSILIPLLEKELFDMELLGFVLLENLDYYLDDVFYFLRQRLPEEIFRDPQYIFEEGLTAEHKMDIWLVFLLKAMQKEKRSEEEFYLLCLSGRYQDVRSEALKALALIQSQWSEKVLPALEEAYQKEPFLVIRKNILCLTGEIAVNKEQCFVESVTTFIKPSLLDEKILNTYIVGTSIRDLYIVDDKIKTGEVLYLKTYPNNKNDQNEVAVITDSGYILGYLPQNEKDKIAQLIKGKERLYAILLSDEFGEDRIAIQVMLSKSVL